MSTRELSHEDVCRAASTLAVKIAKLGAQRIKLYGVPRGGISAMYLVGSALKDQGMEVTYVSEAADADLLIDDLIDSGATRARYEQSNPGVPFLALYDKPGEWLVFPWEWTSGMKEDFASDIPRRLLQYIGEDQHREGLKETPERFLRAWGHYTSGYHQDPAEILKAFEDGAENVDEMVLVRDVPVYSTCEHHLAMFWGVAHVSYIPSGKVVGLSKLVRLVECFARRLQVQERLTQQIAAALQQHLQPKGVGVILNCRHACMESRGVRAPGTSTVTSCMLGAMREDRSARAELLSLIR